MLQLDYYYGIESEQFAFYRVPRLLIKDERFKNLSSDAKLLYGLMLERMSLSMKNGWFDEENRAYIIYTIDSIMSDLGCGKDKAVKVLAELDSNKGIGLVEKIRRGLGKPDIIYVKNFATLNGNSDGEKLANKDKSTEVGKTEFKKSEKPNSGSRENRTQEVGKTELRKSEKPNSRSRENPLPEVGKTAPNYPDSSYTELSYSNHINSINQEETNNSSHAAMDRMNDVNAYIALIKKNIEYEDHMKHDDWDRRGLFDELFEIICEIVCVKRESVRIGKEDYPYEIVKSKFMKLNSSHLDYVIECMRNTNTKITNIKQYMITALYNAPNTMNHYYQQEVRHDMYGGGWMEEGVI